VFEALFKSWSGEIIEPEDQAYLDSTLRSKGYNLASVRAEAVRKTIKELEVIDRLIERQFKNMRLLMQAYESVRFAPQLLKKGPSKSPSLNSALSNPMKISVEKLVANRANAQKSTGPLTAEGKLRSARNSAKHGLSASPSPASNTSSDSLPVNLYLTLEFRSYAQELINSGYSYVQSQALAEALSSSRQAIAAKHAALYRQAE
jgi:hypothetical protein